MYPHGRDRGMSVSEIRAGNIPLHDDNLPWPINNRVERELFGSDGKDC